MNSDTIESALQIAKDAGAIVNCSSCGHYELRADDYDAECRAYAQATKAWKSVIRGFRGMEREDVMDSIKAALDVPIKCPSCEVA